MRVYGRVTNPDGSLSWQVVQTSASGDNSLVYLTALTQCLLLSTNESPFYAANGIPAQQSVLQQVFPDYYVALTQQLFAPYFASLRVSRSSTNVGGVPQPTYQVNIITNQGTKLNASVQIPT